ncbi:MAG: hypothetical protein DME05_06875 [Candidatus Rokuibacteriota bacterium]|nr:MAG: hypothetical protein DME05_06875 [Candidatus Rokubacteria bacterium]
MTVGEAARRVLVSMGVRTTFAGSLHELPLVFEASGVPDLVIVNVTNDVTGWEVATRTQHASYQGRLLAIVDGLDDPRTRYLTRLPNVECVLRPSSLALLEDIVRKAVPEPAPSPARALPPLPASTHHGIIGDSPQMRDIFSRIDKVASGDVNVCIHGESGTGKELIARAIHYASPRRDRPLITLDCTTIPDGLMESHLFGHVKGAFTGAIEHREGVFALAHTGTLFIDEPAARDPDARVLEGRRLEAPSHRPSAHHGDEQGSQGGRRAGHVPRGSLLPRGGLHDQGARAAGADRRHPAPRRAFPPAVHRALRQADHEGRVVHARPHDDAAVAGQRPPAGEFPRAGRRARRGRYAHRP